MQKGSKIVAILEPSRKNSSEARLSSAELNSLYHEKIDNVIKDHNTHIIVSVEFSFAIKYLRERKFRNCTIYALETSMIPPNIGFKIKRGFTSLIELREALKQDSTEIIKEN